VSDQTDEAIVYNDPVIFITPPSTEQLASLMDDLFEGKLAATQDNVLHRVAGPMLLKYASVVSTQRAIEVLCGKVVAALMVEGGPPTPEEEVLLTAMNDRLIRALQKFTRLKQITQNPQRPPAIGTH
jgi:hypothetical protein